MVDSCDGILTLAVYQYCKKNSGRLLTSTNPATYYDKIVVADSHHCCFSATDVSVHHSFYYKIMTGQIGRPPLYSKIPFCFVVVS
jgi:hypothetical protein